MRRRVMRPANKFCPWDKGVPTRFALHTELRGLGGPPQSSPEEGRGVWNPKVQKVVYRQQPNQYFPLSNFMFSHNEIRVRGGGGG